MFRQNKKMIAGVIIVLSMTVSMLLAEVPNLIDYQGRLSDAGGSAVNGNVSILFSIYDVNTGGIALWSETQNSVDVDNGLFQVTLGSSDAMPDTLFNEAERWLGIKVGTDAEMTPRTKLASTPYARYAAKGPYWKEDEYGIYYEGIVSMSLRSSSLRDTNSCVSNLLPQYTDDEMNNLVTSLLPPDFVLYNTTKGAMYELDNDSGMWFRLDNWLKRIPDSDNISNTNSGNVGIGTDNPNGKLGVVGGFGNAFNATNTGSYSSTAKFENTGSGHCTEFRNNSNFSTGYFEQNGTGEVAQLWNYGGGDGIFSGVSGGDGSAGIFNAWSSGDGLYANAHGTGYAGYFDSNTHVNGTFSASDKQFLIDHPLDPANKYLSHACVESPDMMNVYNGNVILDDQGEAVVELPHYFETINMDFRYQLTCIGGFAQVYIAEKISGNEFKIAGGKSGLEVSWQVTGIRNDPYAKAHRIQVEKDKPAHEKGKYLHPELYGQGEEKGMRYEEKMKIMNSRKK